MNLSRILQSVARAHPDAPAITANADSLSYAALDAQTAAIAAALRHRHGLAPGARVALIMENCTEFFPCLYGIWRAGLVAVPINAKLHPREIAWILADCQARMVIATEDVAEQMTRHAAERWPEIIATGSADYQSLLDGEGDSSIAPPTDPEDIAWLFYTSGTTGRPKGAVLTHRNLLFMCHCYYADIDQIGRGDAILHAAPLSHGSGLYALAHLSRGSNNVIISGSFDPARIYAALERHANAAMFAAPTMLARLVSHPGAAAAETRNLKTIIYGGAPMYAADLDRALRLFGPRLYHLYGQGESPMTISGLDKRQHGDSRHPRYRVRLASTGLARTGVAVRVLTEDGREADIDQVGEIVTRSDCLMRGYWNNARATADALRDGWLRTGDLGSLDADGFLSLKDRSKDLIISGGSNIYPREIEELLLTHPAVAECAVVSRPHAEWGEVVVAFVVTRAGDSGNITVDAAALDALCLANIARFKRPKDYRFVDALPKNNYGKVLKTELRKRLASC